MTDRSGSSVRVSGGCMKTVLKNCLRMLQARRDSAQLALLFVHNCTVYKEG